MTITILLLIAVVVIALVFEFINGFHDCANAIATVVSTKVLSPKQAVLFGASLEFVGALTGTHVAKTIGSGIVNAEMITLTVIFCALAAAVIWNLFTWWLGLPSSSSHALIGGLLGATIVKAGVDAVHVHTLMDKVIIPMFTSPVLGFCAGFTLMLILAWFILLTRVHPDKVNKKFRKLRCDIYYNQTPADWELHQLFRKEAHFDNRGNQANRRTYAGYLYDGGIWEALKGTSYEKWTRVFEQMAAAGVCAQYNCLMAAQDELLPGIVEMLFKGRFYRLLREESVNVSYYSAHYVGTLRIADRIEDIFKIQDRQKINRIRNLDGGSLMVEWMRWSDQNKVRISDCALLWLCENGMEQWRMQAILSKMSPEKAMNYIERQSRESYKGKKAKEVASQYADYLSMCERLKKDTSDEMIYRPQELKRRHDEAVRAIEEMEAEITADEYAAQFPGVVEVMQEIREKYEYASEQYIITVPRRCVDIVLEGRALHHCAGSSDRYFDRIKQHETYICFLRRAEEPDKPYYTIEVEPGGTIRQHRGYLDEEPEIEEIRPFLREWQQVLKRRMSEEDRKRARISAVKREENIEELKAKNNTRVLQGLMEDFMEAV